MTEKSPILALDTSTHVGSVALACGDSISFEQIPASLAQVTALHITIEKLLNANGLWYGDLQALAVTVGPGSFTGVRIGLAVARTLAFCCPHIKLHPFNTLQALACGYQGVASRLHVALLAGRGEAYYQVFERQTDGALWSLAPISLRAPSDIPTLGDNEVLLGNSKSFAPHIHPSLTADPELPSAAALLSALTCCSKEPALDLRPLYIRAPDALLPSKPYV